MKHVKHILKALAILAALGVFFYVVAILISLTKMM